MYSLTDLNIEIEQAIERMGNESRLHPDWVAQVVMIRHPGIEGEDSDFYTVVSRAQIRKRLNRYKLLPDLEPDRQPVMQGFEWLQERYLIAGVRIR